MESADLLISPRWLLPISPQNCVLEDHTLVLQSGLIKALLPTPLACEQYDAPEHCILPSHVLMPGLINTHAHTPMNLFRGMADDLPLMTWLQEHIWPAEKALIREESVALGTQLAIAEMLRSGITCFNDHYFFYDTTAKVAADIGMRACIGLVVMNVPTQWAHTESEYLEKARRILTQAEPHDLISFACAPHAPYTVTSDTLKAIQSLAEHHDLPIHIHLHETAGEIEHSLREYQMTPIQRLHQLGLVSNRLIAVHMTQLTDQDMNLLRATGTHVVHCPESNLKLSSGLAPVAKLLSAGINVCLGTDGAASNNDLDLFGEMKTAALLAKGIGKPTDLPASTVLEMATINGARALGLDHKIGSLEPGKAADIIAVDLSEYSVQPVYQPCSHLVYATNRLQVSDVWVAGSRLLKHKNLMTMDVDKLMKRASDWVKHEAEPLTRKAST